MTMPIIDMEHFLSLTKGFTEEERAMMLAVMASSPSDETPQEAAQRYLMSQSVAKMEED